MTATDGHAGRKSTSNDRATAGRRQGHRREIEREFGNGIHNDDPYDDLGHHILGAQIQRDLGAEQVCQNTGEINRTHTLGLAWPAPRRAAPSGGMQSGKQSGMPKRIHNNSGAYTQQ